MKKNVSKKVADVIASKGNQFLPCRTCGAMQSGL